MDYAIKPKEEGGWVGWQTAFGTVVGGLVGYYTGMPEMLAIGVGSFAGASARPVLGYLFRFLPQPK